MRGGGESAAISLLLPKEMSLFIPFIIRKTITAMIRKFITLVINAPYVMVTPEKLKLKASKFLPANRPITGDRILSVNDVTTPWNAPPIIMPTASAITLLCSANSLNSLIKFFIE